MKKLIFTIIVASIHFAHGKAIEQVACQLPNLGAVKGVIIESGAMFEYSGGTLSLLGTNGIVEKVAPSAGIGGTFNQFNFPSYFTYTNDARKSQVLKFETKLLGRVLVAYVCNRPNSYPCEDRSGNLVETARVSININEKAVLNFNGQSLPFCKRRVMNQ
jgi:hypothetical protein